MGGFSRRNLEAYFAPTNPGDWMTARQQRLTIARVEYLIDEDRRISREQREQKEKEAKNEQRA